MTKTIKGQRALFNPKKQNTKVAQPKKVSTKKGVVFFKNLPLGLFEPQLTRFLSQFGDVTRCRLSKNRSTGAYKGYGWCEFAHEEVAQIVADTMDKYVVGGKSIVAALVKKEDLHPETFKHCKTPFKRIPWRMLAIKASASAADEVSENSIKKKISKERALKEQLAALGIDAEPLSIEAMFPEIAKKVDADLARQAEASSSEDDEEEESDE